MDFDFSKLQEAAADLAAKASQGVSYVARKGKETYDRISLENELGKEQRLLGAYYYDYIRTGASHEAAMNACADKIDVLLDALHQMEAPAADAADAGREVCPVCGAEADEDAVFCSQCGHKF